MGVIDETTKKRLRSLSERSKRRQARMDAEPLEVSTAANLFRNRATPTWLIDPDEIRTSPPAESMADRAAGLGVPKRYRSAKISDFTEHDFKRGKTDVALVSRIAAEGFKPGDEGLLICGDNGRGKTYLAAALAIALEAEFVKTREMVIRIGSTMSAAAKEHTIDAMSAYSDPCVIVLDDITALHATDWTLNAVLSILDKRHDEERPTVVTCFHNPDDLSKLNLSLESRVGAFQRILVVGEDRRQKGR